jgi:recombination protein RecA
MFGNPETTPGGIALKFYASVRLDIRRIEASRQGGNSVGNRTRVTVKKNKVAAPLSRLSSTSCIIRVSASRETY